MTLARCPSGIFAMTLTLPTIHNNGTSPEDLAKGFLDGMRAISAAADLLCNAGPNGRDYYPQGSEALPAAITELAAGPVIRLSKDQSAKQPQIPR